MIQIKQDALVITINAGAPLEQLLLFKKSLHNVLRAVDPTLVEGGSGLIYDIQNTIELASELEFDSEQMHQIDLLLSNRKITKEFIITD